MLAFGPQVSLTWTDNADNETAYFVQRSADGGNTFATISSPLAPDSVAYLDITVQPGNTYVYRVYAANATGPSGYSNPVTMVVPPAPLAPTNLVLTVQGLTTGPRITVVFRDNQNNTNPETGFWVVRTVNGTDTQTVTLGARNNTGNVTYYDSNVVGGNSYGYYVVAFNAGSASVPSNTAVIGVPPPPLAPSNFVAANGPNQNNQRRVILTWTDNSNNETGFRIERSSNVGGPWVLVTTTGSNANSFTVTGLTRNTDYCFRIRANNGNFAWSTWVFATPAPIHTIP